MAAMQSSLARKSAFLIGHRPVRDNPGAFTASFPADGDGVRPVQSSPGSSRFFSVRARA